MEVVDDATWGCPEHKQVMVQCPFCEAVAVTVIIQGAPTPVVERSRKQHMEMYPVEFSVATVGAAIDHKVGEGRYHVRRDTNGNPTIRISPQSALSARGETNLLERLREPQIQAGINGNDIIVSPNHGMGINKNGGNRSPTSPATAGGDGGLGSLQTL